MITKSVVTPTGEEIPIVSDDEWLREGATPQGLRMWNAGNKRLILAALWEHGAFEDHRSGHAVTMLTEWIFDNYGVIVSGSSLTMLIKDPTTARAIERIATRQKRTDAVKLKALPETWWQKLDATLRNEIPTLRKEAGTWVEPEPEPTPDAPESPASAPESVDTTTDPPVPNDEEWRALTDAIELDAPSVYDVGPPVEVEIAQSVAMALLTQVVEIISAGTPEQTDARVRSLMTDMAQLSERYSQRLQENDKMRRQLREAGDELKALRFERDGLRSRLRATEANLREVMKGDTAKVVTQEVQKRIDQFMRQTPATKKGED